MVYVRVEYALVRPQNPRLSWPRRYCARRTVTVPVLVNALKTSITLVFMENVLALQYKSINLYLICILLILLNNMHLLVTQNLWYPYCLRILSHLSRTLQTLTEFSAAAVRSSPVGGASLPFYLIFCLLLSSPVDLEGGRGIKVGCLQSSRRLGLRRLHVFRSMADLKFSLRAWSFSCFRSIWLCGDGVLTSRDHGGLGSSQR